MSGRTGTSDNVEQEVYAISLSAFQAEYKNDFEKARSLHTSSIQRINQALEKTGLMEREKKAALKRKARIHEKRSALLATRRSVPSPYDLSVPESRSEEINRLIDTGSSTVGMDDMMLAKLGRDGALDRNVQLAPQFQHLFQSPIPFYTPCIDTSRPNYAYELHRQAEFMPTMLAHLCGLKVKVPGNDQTLYICEALKRKKRQIPHAIFSRVSEYPNPCFAINIGAAPFSWSGRQLRHTTTYVGVIDEKSDREPHRSDWVPRRFTFGGRRFVWKEDPTKKRGAEILYEVKSEWPKPGSKTGKMEDELFEQKLAWTGKFPLYGPLSVEMLGGLDEGFRELILSSQCSRNLIMAYGHMN